jgi:hypothetical protein
VFGWVADAFYLSWSFFYWNLRKTKFRLRRGRSRCPCQAASDSGRAMETRCDAAIHLHKTGRFRHVCPLLKQNAQGHWRCSVNAPDVRPFWPRAFTFFGSILLALYLVGTVGAWGMLRYRGYPISYAAVVWPGKWKDFHLVQSRYFGEKAQRALARSDFPEALMSLSLAYQLNPADYDLGRRYAQLAQAGQMGRADRAYAQLVHDHPARRGETLGAWYETLLWRADFASINHVGKQGLISDPARSSAWTNALLFSLRREPDLNLLRELATSQEIGGARAVFELELQSINLPEQAKRLIATANRESVPEFLDYYRVKRLIELGSAQEALRLLSDRQSRLTPRDTLVLRLEAMQAASWPSLIRTEFETLNTGPLNPAVTEVLAAFLIRHPDSSLLQLTFDGFMSKHPPENEITYRTWAALLCAAGANGDLTRYRHAVSEMRRLSGSQLRAFTSFEGFFRQDTTSARIENYLSSVQPLPMEITYALLERYYQPRGSKTQRRVPVP